MAIFKATRTREIELMPEGLTFGEAEDAAFAGHLAIVDTSPPRFTEITELTLYGRVCALFAKGKE